MDTLQNEQKLRPLSLIRQTVIFLLALYTLALLSACGGGGGGGGGDSPTLNTGVFIDAPVQGLDFETDTQSGTTNSQGTFRYETGQQITFYLGDVLLGTTLGRSIITPLDLVSGADDETDPTVTNMLRLLQSLDVDGNPDNGIVITPDIAGEVTGRALNVGNSPETFGNDLADLVETLNDQGAFTEDTPRNPRTPEEAQEHFREVMGEPTDPTALAALFDVVPEPVIVLEPVVFDASGSTGEITEYTWDFGDGETGTGVEISHTFAETGIYLVTLTVSGEGSEEANSTQEIEVIVPPNEPPVAIISADPMTGVAPLRVLLVSSESYDPDGKITSYRWDFGDAKFTFGMNAYHTYQQPGTYTAKMTLTDNEGATSEASVEIIVTGPLPNETPTAAFTAEPESGEAPLTVAFNASGSSDPDGTIETYSWNFGDGKTGSGRNTSNTFRNPGTYVVALTVTDNDGGTDSTSMEIVVLEEAAADCETNNPCDIHATCDDSGEEITCTCNTGWTGNGFTCTEIVIECENGDTRPDGGSACGLNNRGEYGRICVEGSWQNNTDVCSDPDVCIDESVIEGTGTCGFNGNGAEIQLCVEGQWTESCDDPDECENGAALEEGGSACGLNSRGEYGQTCVEGSWQDNTETCNDPDECVDESVTDGTTPCGLNENGTLMQECAEGQWADSEICDDPDVCTNGNTRVGETACSGGFYQQLCDGGQWENTTECISPSEDADGDGVNADEDPDDTDFTVCGDSDSDGCDDCSVSGEFDPDNDGWDQNGDGNCELPLDYDCMNGANAATDPYRLQACIMFTYVNQDRDEFAAESDNAAPVRWNEYIWEVAVAHSIDMCENVFFAHVNLSGQNPSGRAAAAGLSYGLAENIAINLDPGAAQYAFMEEPTCVGHRSNVLEPRAYQGAVGYHICDNPSNTQWDGYHFVTQNFRWNFAIGASEYCQNSANVCQVPPNPPTTATCPSNLISWGFCPVPSEDTLTGWGCQ